MWSRHYGRNRRRFVRRRRGRFSRLSRIARSRRARSTAALRRRINAIARMTVNQKTTYQMTSPASEVGNVANWMPLRFYSNWVQIFDGFPGTQYKNLSLLRQRVNFSVFMNSASTALQVVRYNAFVIRPTQRFDAAGTSAQQMTLVNTVHYQTLANGHVVFNDEYIEVLGKRSFNIGVATGEDLGTGGLVMESASALPRYDGTIWLNKKHRIEYGDGHAFGGHQMPEKLVDRLYFVLFNDDDTRIGDDRDIWEAQVISEGIPYGL